MLSGMWTASPDRIAAAAERIDSVFLNTPLRASPALDARLSATLLFKDETANPIRSFKGRGTCNFVAALETADRLVCASAGNFGQGLAWAARNRALPLIVFAARNAIASKVMAMRRLGAEVRLEGEDFDAAKEAAAAFAAISGARFVEDGAHAAIAEGAGTLALEAVEAAGHLDAWLVPLGNGALAAGTCAWVKHAAPEARRIAISTKGAPAMGRSVEAGEIVTTPTADTIADGIAVRIPIPSAVAAVRAVADEVIYVADDDIRAAMALLRAELDLVVEPAGAVGLAAVLAAPERWRGQRLVMPLCGGNV